MSVNLNLELSSYVTNYVERARALATRKIANYDHGIFAKDYLKGINALDFQTDHKRACKSAKVIKKAVFRDLSKELVGIEVSRFVEEVKQATGQSQVEKYVEGRFYNNWRGKCSRLLDGIARLARCILGKVEGSWSQKRSALADAYDAAEKQFAAEQPHAPLRGAGQVEKDRGVEAFNKGSKRRLKLLRGVVVEKNPGHRKQVMSLGDVQFRATVVRTQKEACEQLKSYDVQWSSTQPRDPIREEISLSDGTQLISEIIPAEETTTSSRQKKGCVDPTNLLISKSTYHSSIGSSQGNVVSSVRAGVLIGPRGESDSSVHEAVRLEKANRVCEAALAVATERETEGEIELYIISGSLLTPGCLGSNRELLKQQLAVYKDVENQQLPISKGSITTSGVHPLCFNHGVNLYATKWNGGVDYQHGPNKQALSGLKALWKKIYNEAIAKGFMDVPVAICQLMSDIEELESNPKSYLEHGNPYEVGAKLTLLANEMNAYAKAAGLSIRVAKVTNCESGKDRTGIEDAVTRTLQAMKGDLSSYPTHQELADADTQKKFIELYAKIILSYGGLEVTRDNTRGCGYKEDVRLYPEHPLWMKDKHYADIARDAEGLSFLATV